jgi:hypothetical protein
MLSEVSRLRKDEARLQINAYYCLKTELRRKTMYLQNQELNTVELAQSC